MANISTVLITSTAYPVIGMSPITLPIVSEHATGTGYYSNPNGMHTVSYSTSGSMIGIIKMQGSLATAPGVGDWVDITGTVLGDGINPIPDGTVTFNFTGNFVWVQAVIPVFSQGNVISVLYTHN